jgi:hypothetical protein
MVLLCAAYKQLSTLQTTNKFKNQKSVLGFTLTKLLVATPTAKTFLLLPRQLETVINYVLLESSQRLRRAGDL